MTDHEVLNLVANGAVTIGYDATVQHYKTVAGGILSPGQILRLIAQGKIKVRADDVEPEKYVLRITESGELSWLYMETEARRNRQRFIDAGGSFRPLPWNQNGDG